MLSQQANLHQFINNYLADVVNWEKHVRPDKDREKEITGDKMYVQITTDYNRYLMSSLSAYVEPPPGAPFQCSALGTIEFTDLTGTEPFHFVGPRQDATFIKIADHVRRREAREQMAAIRRQMAEAGSQEEVNRLRSKLEMLQGKAIGQPLPAEPVTVKAPDTVADALLPGPLQFVSELPSVIPNSSDLYIGCPIIYITNPGEAISGMSEIPGQCVKIYSNGVISAFLTPDHSEPMYKDSLHRRGGAVRHNCWDFNPGHLAQLARVDAIDKLWAKISGDVIDVVGRLDAIEKALTEPKNVSSRVKKP